MYNSVIAGHYVFRNSTTRTFISADAEISKQARWPWWLHVTATVDDLDAARTRAEAAKVRVVMDAPKRKYHGVTGAAVHLHPADTGGVLTSFDWMEEWESWAWGGQAWPWHQRTDVVSGIVGAEISCSDPGRVAQRFSEFIGRGVDAQGRMERRKLY